MRKARRFRTWVLVSNVEACTRSSRGNSGGRTERRIYLNAVPTEPESSLPNPRKVQAITICGAENACSLASKNLSLNRLGDIIMTRLISKIHYFTRKVAQLPLQGRFGHADWRRERSPTGKRLSSQPDRAFSLDDQARPFLAEIRKLALVHGRSVGS
jgi:hypothetical protein